MNQFRLPGSLLRSVYKLVLRMRWIGKKPVSKVFGTAQLKELIQQIYVINLDRQTARWRQMLEEFRHIYDGAGAPLSELAQRFPAIDARDPEIALLAESVVEANYSLADQLYVEPQPSLSGNRVDLDQTIQLTRQELAVALSHVEVWRRIAGGEHDFALVLEDDTYFHYKFAKQLGQVWQDLKDLNKLSSPFDLLYLSYKEVKGGAQKSDISDFIFKPYRGLWYMSGYVLSKKGAQKLLSLLPVVGPVDLWINHQFEKLDVLASSKSVIKQRIDFRSSNSYSILPTLSKIGVLAKESPSVFEVQPLRKPVFAFGEEGTGLTSLAMALSMLGYRCCSDVAELPKLEQEKLLQGSKRRIFDCYVNVGSLREHYVELASRYPSAKFIMTATRSDDLEIDDDIAGIADLSKRFLILPADSKDKWKVLGEFLECVSPVSKYPILKDRNQRRISHNYIKEIRKDLPQARMMKFDASPWIVAAGDDWTGVPTDTTTPLSYSDAISEQFRELDGSLWELRNDTFPSNLALFEPGNFSINGSTATLKLQKESSGVRHYTGTSICSVQEFLYGKFEATVKPSNTPGVITGMFLHRNSPRQEIDIEFLGKDTTRLLLNVYYNPGDDGALFDYGYRGTPIIVDLGFDASEAFHVYKIEWSPRWIRWFVDGNLVYERYNWEPTPIPHLPMQFHMNLWPTRSIELAGKIIDSNLPTNSLVKSVQIQTLNDSNTGTHNS